jgi:hypothetical protein
MGSSVGNMRAPGSIPVNPPEGQLPQGPYNLGSIGGKGGGVVNPPPADTTGQGFAVAQGTVQPQIIPDETGGRTPVPTSPAAGQTTGTPNMFQAASQSIYDAMGGARDIMGYQPMNVSATRYDPARIGADFNLGFERVSSPGMEAAQTTQADIERFYNPYTTEVIDQSMADIERNRLMQANQAAAQAQAAGAFGGSRGALMEAEIARNALEQQARTGGQLRQQGFTTAAQLAQQDVARRQQAGQLNAQQALQAALANQATGFQAGMANQQAGLQASLANQAAINAARSGFRQQELQANLANQAAGLQGAGMRLGAGTQLANLGNLGFTQAQSTLQGMQQQGLLQQMLMQSLMDRGAGQYGAYSGQLQDQLGMLTSALSGVPIPSTTTQGGRPGLLDLGQSAAMIYSLMSSSDIRLKDDVKKVGELENGLGVYTWRWNEIARGKGIRTPEIGVLAQEVAEVIPSAVAIDTDGYLMVDYGKVL